MHREGRHTALGYHDGFLPVLGIHGDIDHQDGVPDGMVPVSLIDENVSGGNIGKAWKEASEAFGFRLTQCCPPEYRMPDTEWEKDLEERERVLEEKERA